MDFEWDAAKAEMNERKHTISFEVAVEVFEDTERIERLDSDSSDEEERWAATGLIDGTEVYVVYAERGEVIRLITARRANRHE